MPGTLLRASEGAPTVSYTIETLDAPARAHQRDANQTTNDYREQRDEESPMSRHAVDCCGSSVAVVKGTNVELPLWAWCRWTS
jgi:hypothetical protein